MGDFDDGQEGNGPTGYGYDPEDDADAPTPSAAPAPDASQQWSDDDVQQAWDEHLEEGDPRVLDPPYDGPTAGMPTGEGQSYDEYVQEHKEKSCWMAQGNLPWCSENRPPGPSVERGPFPGDEVAESPEAGRVPMPPSMTGGTPPSPYVPLIPYVD